MKEIPLSQGKIALIDDTDFEWLNQWKWCAWKGRTTFYALRNEKSNGKRITIRMHQLILGISGNVQTDHKDGNGLNNQRFNIRECTVSQNLMNQRKHRDGQSKYKGVSWDKTKKKWTARVCVEGKNKHFGRYCSELEAATAYDLNAAKLFGEFARINQVTI